MNGMHPFMSSWAECTLLCHPERNEVKSKDLYVNTKILHSALLHSEWQRM